MTETFYERIPDSAFTSSDVGGFTTAVFSASLIGFTLSPGDVLIGVQRVNSVDPITNSDTVPGDWSEDVDEAWTPVDGNDIRVKILSRVWGSGDDQSTYTATFVFADPMGGGSVAVDWYWAGAGGMTTFAHTRYPDPTAAGTEHDAIPSFGSGTWDAVFSRAQAGLVAVTYTWGNGDWLGIGVDPEGYTSLDMTFPTGTGLSFNDDAHSATNGYIMRGILTSTPPPPSAIRASHNKLRTARLGVS